MQQSLPDALALPLVMDDQPEGACVPPPRLVRERMQFEPSHHAVTGHGHQAIDPGAGLREPLPPVLERWERQLERSSEHPRSAEDLVDIPIVLRLGVTYPQTLDLQASPPVGLAIP
jgi:hypothetical protein